jgi:hypothetical protein
MSFLFKNVTDDAIKSYKKQHTEKHKYEERDSFFYLINTCLSYFVPSGQLHILNKNR